MKGKLHKMVSGYILSLNGDIDDPYAIVNEELAKDYEWYKLSLKNCQAIECGYDLDEEISNIVKTIVPDDRGEGVWFGTSIAVGKLCFKKALELMGDKKFSEDDIHHAIDISVQWALRTKGVGETYQEMSQRILKSIQQTEWDVEVVMEPCFYDDSLGGFSTSYKEGMPTEQPKLDSNDCLILRKI